VWSIALVDDHSRSKEDRVNAWQWICALVCAVIVGTAFLLGSATEEQRDVAGMAGDQVVNGAGHAAKEVCRQQIPTTTFDFLP
jgi:hypothetical protein